MPSKKIKVGGQEFSFKGGWDNCIQSRMTLHNHARLLLWSIWEELSQPLLMMSSVAMYHWDNRTEQHWYWAIVAELILNKLSWGVELVIAGKCTFWISYCYNGFIGVPIAFYPHQLMHKLASHTWNLIVWTATYHNANSAWKSDNKTNL